MAWQCRYSSSRSFIWLLDAPRQRYKDLTIGMSQIEFYVDLVDKYCRVAAQDFTDGVVIINNYLALSDTIFASQAHFAVISINGDDYGLNFPTAGSCDACIQIVSAALRELSPPIVSAPIRRLFVTLCFLRLLE